MVEKPPYYRVYLLTVWKEDHQRTPGAWRFHLEDPHTGQRRAFASVVALVAALQAGFIGTEGADSEPSAPAR